jgi:MFS family permease
LLRELPGYGNGLAVGALYFTGFTGVFLVLSVFLQEGLDLTPLHTGLLLTPFAMASAITAPLAGRIVSVIGRRITVIALSVMMTGVLGVAVLVPLTDSDTLAWALVPALVVAGLGGGGVVNPNFTLALAEVPPHMGGAAGAALQTGQRIGSSIGAALLMTIYQLAQPSVPPERALQAALATALVVLALALLMAVRALREQNR